MIKIDQNFWKEEKDLELIIKKEYFKWVKNEYPEYSNELISISANAYIEFLKYLKKLDQKKAIEVIEKFKNTDNWNLTPKEEILLNILTTCEVKDNYKEKNLILLNGFLIQQKNIGFVNYQFGNIVDPRNGNLTFYSEDLERDLYILEQNELIKIKITSTPKVAIKYRGEELLKQNITYYVFREQYDKIVLKDINDFYNKSPIEREQLYQKSLLL